MKPTDESAGRIEPMVMMICPFCGTGKNLFIGWSGEEGRWRRRVICVDCDIAGPEHMDDEMAIKTWNDRQYLEFMSSGLEAHSPSCQKSESACFHCGEKNCWDGIVIRDVSIKEALELFRSKINKYIMWVTEDAERVVVKS